MPLLVGGVTMEQTDKELYDYLTDNVSAITDEWLALRLINTGSIYSLNAGQKAEALLREQNKLTNMTIACSLLGNEENFIENKEKWAHVIAESRVNTNTPITDVLEALTKVRIAYWGFIEKFAKTNEEIINKDDLLRWGNRIHGAFDELYVEFSAHYFRLMNDKISIQSKLIDDLSAPIINISNTVGILPIIGNIDSGRADKLLDYVPKKCTEEDIQHLYIDLSGMLFVDTMVAHQILKITHILKLLGIKVTITGIRPEIAQTTVQLGLDFKSIETFSSLQQALDYTKQ